MNTATTLDESRIANLVDRFYDKVQADPSIGPIFNAAVHDWPEHKRLLTSFWCSVALRAASYRGNPMSVHRAQRRFAPNTSCAGWNCGAKPRLKCWTKTTPRKCSTTPNASAAACAWEWDCWIGWMRGHSVFR